MATSPATSHRRTRGFGTISLRLNLGYDGFWFVWGGAGLELGFGLLLLLLSLVRNRLDVEKQAAIRPLAVAADDCCGRHDARRADEAVVVGLRIRRVATIAAAMLAAR